MVRGIQPKLEMIFTEMLQKKKKSNASKSGEENWIFFFFQDIFLKY